MSKLPKIKNNKLVFKASIEIDDLPEEFFWVVRKNIIDNMDFYLNMDGSIDVRDRYYSDSFDNEAFGYKPSANISSMIDEIIEWTKDFDCEDDEYIESINGLINTLDRSVAKLKLARDVLIDPEGEFDDLASMAKNSPWIKNTGINPCCTRVIAKLEDGKLVESDVHRLVWKEDDGVSKIIEYLILE